MLVLAIVLHTFGVPVMACRVNLGPQGHHLGEVLQGDDREPKWGFQETDRPERDFNIL